MENLQTNTIERIKNILIVVLVITAVLLLYFLWGSESLESFIFNETPVTYEVLGTEKVLVPSQVVLCRGNEDYTISFSKKEELWNDQILGTFKSFSDGANILVEEITEEQYKMVMQYSSIMARFEYNIPFAGFCEKYGIKPPQGYEAISNLTQLGFSQGSEESAFVFDGSKNKYYRLVGSKNLKIFDQVDMMLAEQGYTTYYTLKTFLGKEESTNNTLIPLEPPIALSPVWYEKDTEMNQTDIIESMAQAYFGSTFDFVRKVEESNGTTIYMYGYGQRVLIINPNEGSIEYKEETKYSQAEGFTMFEAIDTAMAFVGSHGGFKTIGGQQIKPYIESVSQIGDKKNGFRIGMSFLVGKNKLFYENGAPITIEVTDGQVSYFRRELINFDETESEQTSNKEAISAINMLTNNYEYAKNVLIKKGVIDKAQTEMATFESIANKIDNLYMGYLKPTPETVEGEIPVDKEGSLVPVWVVSTNGILLYFDLYDGEPVGYSVNR